MRKIEFDEFKLCASSKKHVDEVFNSDFIANSKIKEFESRFASILNASFCRMVSSGVTANTIACMTLYEFGATQGSEIICPALSSITTTNSIIITGFKPVFVDIKSGNDMNIDVDLIEKAITSKTMAIMAVNLMGRPADLDVIRNIADKHKLYVIVDNSHGYGCSYNGKRSIEYADFETTSHSFFGCEFGCVLTKDEKHDKLVEVVRGNGRMGGSLYFDHPFFGVNGKSSDFYAAIGLGELERFWENFYLRRCNISFFHDSLLEYSDLIWMNQPDDSTRFNAPHAFNVVFKNSANTEKFKKDMDAVNIRINKNFGYSDFPMSKYVGNNGYHWGCHRYLSHDDLYYIVENVKNSFRGMKV